MDISLSDIGHAVLDAVGMVPVIGAAADVANGIWYAADGDYLDAGLSFAGAIPVLGDAALGSKYAIKGGKDVVKAVEGVEDVVKDTRTAVRTVHAGQDLVAGAKTVEHASADTEKAVQTANAAKKAEAAQAQARAAARAEAKATAQPKPRPSK